GQERDRRRHCDGLSGQGRSRNICPAARQGRKQRQGAAGCQIPVATVGNGPVCLEARSLRGNAEGRNMATQTLPTTSVETEVRDSWLPMIVIAMGQMLMSFNVAAIPVSMGGMVESFNTPPTTVGTAIVLYSLGVSGFIMLGAKLGQRFGSKIFFQTA